MNHKIFIMSRMFPNSLNDSLESSINMHAVAYSRLEGCLLKKRGHSSVQNDVIKQSETRKCLDR